MLPPPSRNPILTLAGPGRALRRTRACAHESQWSVIGVVSTSPIICSVAVSSAFDSTPVWQREYIRIQRVTRFRRV